MAGEKDKLEGKAKEVGGKVQQAAGDLGDDAEMKAKGHANEKEGKAQGILGKVKDAAGDVVDTVKDKVDDLADKGKQEAHKHDTKTH